MQTKLYKYNDPSHGWLGVPMSELNRLGIAEKISPYSYRRGQMAYLEEDSDMPLYLAALDLAGEPWPAIGQIEEEDWTRNYSHYWI